MPSNDPELWTQRVELHLTLMHCLTAHGFLSLALRHPEAARIESRAWVEDVLQTVESILLEKCALSADEIEAARADRPVRDA